MPATARPAKARATASETLPIEERIRRRAYELYVQRGNQSGSELDDWLQAEEEIRRAEEMAARNVQFSMPPTKQDFGGLLAQFVDSEGGHCSVSWQ